MLCMGFTQNCSRIVRPFSHSTATRARRTVQEIRQSKVTASEKPTPEELQRILFRESERTFGPNIRGDPAAFANTVSDDVWKDVLKASGNDPQVFKAWRDDIKSRAATLEQQFIAVPAHRPFRSPLAKKPIQKP